MPNVNHASDLSFFTYLIHFLFVLFSFLSVPHIPFEKPSSFRVVGEYLVKRSIKNASKISKKNIFHAEENLEGEYSISERQGNYTTLDI